MNNEDEVRFIEAVNIFKEKAYQNAKDKRIL